MISTIAALTPSATATPTLSCKVWRIVVGMAVAEAVEHLVEPVD